MGGCLQLPCSWQDGVNVGSSFDCSCMMMDQCLQYQRRRSHRSSEGASNDDSDEEEVNEDDEEDEDSEHSQVLQHGDESDAEVDDVTDEDDDGDRDDDEVWKSEKRHSGDGEVTAAHLAAYTATSL